MKTSNLFYEIDLESVLKDVELFKVEIDPESKSTIIQHKLVRMELCEKSDQYSRNLISTYIGDQLKVMWPPIFHLNGNLVDTFITSGKPRMIPAIVGQYHFKDNFITDYFEGINDISVSVFPTVSPSTIRGKILVGITATLYVKRIETNSYESANIGFISRKDVDVNQINVDRNVFLTDNVSAIDFYGICFNSLTEHDQILRKKIIEKLIKFI